MNGQQPRPRGRAGRGRHDHILLAQSADHLTTPQPMTDITVKSRTPNAAELCCFRCYSTSCVATSTTGGALSRPNKYPQSWKWDTRSKWLPNLRSHSKRRPRCFVQYRVSVEWSGADFQDVLSAWRVRIPERSAALALSLIHISE